MRRSAALVLAVGMALAVAPGASAGPAATVDPSTLMPPPSGNFDLTCVNDGRAITCTGSEVQTFVDLDIGDGGFACDGRGIIDNGRQVRTGTFTYDLAGRATRWFDRGTFDELWHLYGSANPTLRSSGNWSTVNDFAVPGDITSRTRTYRGAPHRVIGPRGLVYNDAGLVVLDWNESNILALHGPHLEFTDFDAARAAVCSAFGV